MVTIQIIGKTPASQLSTMLTKLLAHTPYRILTVKKPVPTPKPGDRIYLFLDPCGKMELPQPASGKTIAIVSAENTEILKLLQNCSIHTIPCGLSDHNTITLASSTEESTVISLQRSITALTGEIIEPMEFPVSPKLTPLLSRYLLMALCAVGCVTGSTQKLIPFLREPPV